MPVRVRPRALAIRARIHVPASSTRRVERAQWSVVRRFWKRLLRVGLSRSRALRASVPGFNGASRGGSWRWGAHGLATVAGERNAVLPTACHFRDINCAAAAERAAEQLVPNQGHQGRPPPCRVASLFLADPPGGQGSGEGVERPLNGPSLGGNAGRRVLRIFDLLAAGAIAPGNVPTPCSSVNPTCASRSDLPKPCPFLCMAPPEGGNAKGAPGCHRRAIFLRAFTTCELSGSSRAMIER